MSTSFLNSTTNAIADIVTFKKPLRSLAVFGVIALGIYIVFFAHKAAAPTAVDEIIPVVQVSGVSDISNGSTFSTIGTVEAISEAQLKVETGGQVKSVNTEIGKTVTAGTVLLQVENARESAALLQAQGAYEAAVAGSAQSGVGISEAENGVDAALNAAVSVYKNAYTSVSGSLYGSIDRFYSSPEASTPGVRLSGGNSDSLNRQRVALQTTLVKWKDNATNLTTDGDINRALAQAESDTKSVIAIVDSLIEIINKTDTNSKVYTEAELLEFTQTLNGVRASLQGNITAIDGVRTGITSANENLNRAKISGSGSQVSLSDAQIKIALGSLRSAQASFEKTLVRTPITGVVNAFYIKKGDYVNPGQDAAVVANNNGLQVSTSINLEDRDLLNIGDRVNIEDKATGTITAIAGAVDPKNGKVAVKLSVESNSGLTNGTAVKINFKKEEAETNSVKNITVPIAAIKLAAEGPQVFIVDENNTLVAKNITLGDITGESVIVTEGLDSATKIVLDARGLKAGTKVTVATN